MEEYIKQYIKKCLDIDCDIELTIPKNLSNGDFTSNIAMKLRNTLNISSEKILEMLKNNLNSDSIIEKIELVGPGFLNFYVKKSYLQELVDKILVEKKEFPVLNKKDYSVNIEYVSANPTGILHLGTARGACYGDSLARILSKYGYNVTKEYYTNDGGNQIKNLGISVFERYKELCGLPSNLPEDGYYGNEIIDIAKLIYDEDKDTRLNDNLDYFKDYGVKILFDNIKLDLKNINVEFDVWSMEKTFYDNNDVIKVIEKLKSSGYTYEIDDALWLKTSNFFDEKDRVLIKKDKTYTYLVPDIAYHNNKYQRNYDLIIDVFGADHHGYINRLKSSMEMLGNDSSKLDIKILQLVKLVKDNEEIKMSKRTGKTITIKELTDMIGKDALRYFYIMKSLDTQMEIDLDILNKKNQQNPLYYVSYAHARICSILREFKNSGIENLKDSKIKIENCYEIVKKLSEYESIIEKSALKKMPHLVTNYLYDLASLFHSYYAKNKIITDNVEETLNNIKLITAIKYVISNALNLIGIKAPEKM